jgi:phenylalanyl-tRNA synthetase beta chain
VRDIVILHRNPKFTFSFFCREKPPHYKAIVPASGKCEQMTIAPSTAQIRPFAVAAILRDVTFDKSSYDSFIDLQVSNT